MKKKKCENCGRLITICNYGKHYNACIRNDKKVHKKIENKWKIGEDKYKCPHCDKIYCKNGISTHIWRTHGKGITHNSNEGYIKGTRKIWNKGLTKETDERVKKYANTIKSKLASGELKNNFKGKKHTKKSRKLISQKLSVNNKGGRCKWFEYEKKNGKIVKLQGTWEVRFAKVLDIIDENWIKLGATSKNHSLKWVDENGETHNYTPDFYSKKFNKYYEVKGYWWGNDKIKMDYVFENNKDVNIEMVFKKDLERYEKLI